MLDLQKDLRNLGSAEKARNSAWFFKTGPGQYGEGDKFLGVTVPEIRKTVKSYWNLTLQELQILLDSEYHEERLAAALILSHQATKADDAQRKTLCQFYLKNTHRLNNWDIVDSSAEYVVGAYYLDKDWSKLKRLARSKNIWERRIAMIATYADIKRGKSEQALAIAEILVHDPHDLIQKAVGWMLREVGKRVSRIDEEKFLDTHAASMPRTMLRYALEHFPADLRSVYLAKRTKKRTITAR